MPGGQRSADRHRGVHVVAPPGGLPVTRIVLGTEDGPSSTGSARIGRPAVLALLARPSRGLTGEAA
jgi:hypothetical protein